MKDEERYTPRDKDIGSIVRHSTYDGDHRTGAWRTGTPVFVSFFCPAGKERGKVGCRRSGTALYDVFQGLWNGEYLSDSVNLVVYDN